MSVAIVSLPSGLEPNTDSLRDLVSSGSVDFYEISATGEVVLYWRYLRFIR
jgi:hypothetical protein